MSIKSLLCVFDGTADGLSGLNTALALTKSRAAQLRILHITPPITAAMVGIIANCEITDAIEEDNETRLKKAKDYINKYAALYEIPLDNSDPQKHHPSAKFVHRIGTIDEIVSEEGRLSDIVIISRNVTEASILYDDAALTALFDTGRPLLVAPNLQEALPMEWHKNIALTWNGSLESARALYNAMSFLEEAEKVHVFVVQGHNEKQPVINEVAILDYLHSHNFTATITLIDRGSESAGKALLAKAHMLDIDLLVMGAYGHTRAREMILGGVTNYMLENADIPLLLSH